MATLVENITKTKENFRNIRNAINTWGDKVSFERLTDEPVEEYTTRLNDVVDVYGFSNYEEGYEHGKAAGGGGVDLSKCKYIPKQATGKVIALNDVSEVYHKVKVYADEPTEVDVYGKNLLPYPYHAKYGTHNGITFSDNGDGGVIVSGTATTDAYFVLVNMDIGTSGINATTNVSNTNGTYAVSKYINYNKDNKNVTLKIPSGTTVNEILYPVIVKGTYYDGEYEPYTKQTITATPNGAEANSLCPSMTFLADSDITVDYYSSFGMAESQKRFANSFQNNGARRDYTYAFLGSAWDDYTFEQAVNRDIIATSANQAFYRSKITDLASIMSKKGIKIIFEGTGANFVSLFQGSTITHIPELVMPQKASGTSLCRGCSNLHTIDKLTCNENTKFTDSFTDCTSFTHCIFSGVIANDINMQDCSLLDAESALSLCDSLKWLEWVPGEDGEVHREKDVTVTLHPNVWKMLEKYDQFGQLIDETPEEEIGIPMIEHIIGDKGCNIA